MTNTKFRKRALLSSVAMLLVALVALGSATFAWFAENPDAKASGLSAKTTKATGLDIKAEIEGNWGNDVHLNGNGSTAFNLSPVSQCQAAPATFYWVGAEGPTAYDALGTEVINAVSAGHTGVERAYAEAIYFGLSDGGDPTDSRDVALKSVKINSAANTPHLLGSIRVTVVTSAGDIIGTYAVGTPDANKTIPQVSTGTTFAEVYDEDADPAVDQLVEFGPVVSGTAAGLQTGTAGQKINVNKTVATGVSNASKTDEDKYVTVYVWLDGQDGGCHTTNVTVADAAAIIEGVELEFTLAS